MAANIGKKLFTATIKVVFTANTKLSGHVEADEVAKMIRKQTGYSAMVYEFVENTVEVTKAKKRK